MLLKTLPAELIQRLLKPERDVLTPRAEERLSQIKNTPCERCGGAQVATVDTTRPFGDDALPRLITECRDCGRRVDHQTGIILALGNPAAVESPIPLWGEDGERLP